MKPWRENTQTLGLVAVGPRDILPGLEYDHLLPPASGKDTIVHPNGSVQDTVKLMAKIVRQNVEDTSKLAKRLQRGTLKDTLKNIWEFSHKHIQYRLDEKGLEQLRVPRRTWHDRKEGVDCDCFSIWLSSILLNLGIPHRFRITKYEGGWQHVYIVVPDKSHSRGYFTLDCVLDQFDYEKPFSDKFEFTMTQHSLNGIPIAVLNGFNDSYDYTRKQMSLLDENGLQLISGLGSSSGQMDAIYSYLVQTRDFIRENPASVLTAGGAPANLQALDYAIKNWNTPNREKSLELLAREEERWNELSGLNCPDDSQIGSLGKTKEKKQFWSKVKDAAGKVKDAAGKVLDKAKDALKNVGQAIIKYNPVTVAMRGGFLLALKLDMFQMASELAPAIAPAAFPIPVSGNYSTMAGAAGGAGTGKDPGGAGSGKGGPPTKPRGKTGAEGPPPSWVVSAEFHLNNAKRRYAAIKKLFVDTLQGKVENLDKAILEGAKRGAERAKRKSLKGLGSIGSLGEAVTATALVTAAPVLLKAYATVHDGMDSNPISENAIKVEDGVPGGADPATRDAAKKGITAFIARIKEWIAKRKEKGMDTEDLSVAKTTAEENETSDSTETDPADNSATNPGSGSSNNQSSNTPPPPPEDEENAFVAWVKENTGTVVVISTLFAAGIVTVAVPSLRKKIFGGGSKAAATKTIPSAGLKGASTGKKEKKKTKTRQNSSTKILT